MVLSGGGRVEVLGVGVDRISVEGLHAEVARLARRRGGIVLNVNAHCLNLCHGDDGLRRFFAGADVVFCDGAGVRLAARMLGERLPERITYADWLPRLAILAEAQGLSIFFLGARPGVAGEAARRLRESHPGLKIVGVRHGFFDHGAGSPENGAVLAEINTVRPDILLVGLGMPLQERWLMENHHRLDFGVALTGGAVFDYASGKLRRGPRLLTDNGFEWLARLLVEPRRLWRRYLLGNPLFLARVLAQRLRGEAASRKGRDVTYLP
ncbi:MAG: N-acetylmannosaminyltransferase [uncultured Rubrobacteraceae bacterium]|uniref:N-acetylmannosaminyltransferase n=1 Tax=uncultured Rubrobacteraceae bacterium TaxID=349277 RepID=A0A6J4T7C1_9ACTN|nr:MAG: N-acetylmannosaminyltransferase [uncultured Rubrobacteraceae bacterium]